jgi:hypothetical protein
MKFPTDETRIKMDKEYHPTEQVNKSLRFSANISGEFFYIVLKNSASICKEIFYPKWIGGIINR